MAKKAIKSEVEYRIHKEQIYIFLNVLSPEGKNSKYNRMCTWMNWGEGGRQRKEISQRGRFKLRTSWGTRKGKRNFW